MPELISTINAIHRVERREQKFMAAIQGIDLDKDGTEENTSTTAPVTVEDVMARAVARITGDENAAGAAASGITSEMGLQYKIMEGTEIG
jgi:hypothetical protein